MESCDSLTSKNYQCSNSAKYCINYKGEKINFCNHHMKYHSGVDEPDSIVNPDYYYDENKGKLVVNRISRVPHDPITNLPTRYTEGLTDRQKKKYLKEIEESKEYYSKTGKIKGREPVSRSLSPQRSKYVEEFEQKYNFSITDDDKIHHYFPDTDVETILSKGRAAYASGSRPTVTGASGPERWARARLASVLVGGKALAVDKNLVGPKSLKKIFS